MVETQILYRLYTPMFFSCVDSHWRLILVYCLYALGRWRPPSFSQIKDNAFLTIGLYFCRILFISFYRELLTHKITKYEHEELTGLTEAIKSNVHEPRMNVNQHYESWKSQIDEERKK